MTSPAWGTLCDGAGTPIRDATEDEWRESALSTSPINADTPPPPGVFLSHAGQVVYVEGGPDPSTA